MAATATTLVAAVVGVKHGRHGHHRLAAAHVALDEAVHLHARLGIADHVAQSALLSPGELEGQDVVHELLRVVARVVERGAGHLLLPPPHLGEHELDHEQLVEFEAALGLS